MKWETKRQSWCCRAPGFRNEVTEATESDDSWGSFFPWPEVKAWKTDGTEGVMVGAQGFGVTKDSQNGQEAFDFDIPSVPGKQI